MENKNYGLIIPPIKTREQGAEHILGALEKPVINLSGNWIPFLPEKEPQFKNGVETFGCAIYGTLNALETLLKFKGYDVNYSDRYLALEGKRLGKINIPKDYGSDPHKVAELIRETTGLLREDKLPFSDGIKSLDDYYNVPESTLIDLFKEGQAWYKEWSLNHEWVFQGGKPNEKRLQLQQALEKGTVCVSVLAWRMNEKGLYYKPEGAKDNHWTQLAYAPVDKYTNFDSYDAYLKDLGPLYDFNIAKVYYLSPISLEEIKKEKLDIIEKILKAIAKILSLDWLLLEKIKESKNKPIQPLIDDLKPNTDNIPPIPQTPNPDAINPQDNTLNPFGYPYFDQLDRQSTWFIPNPSDKWGVYPEDKKQKLIEAIKNICQQNSLSPTKIKTQLAVIDCESGWNPFAINKNKDGTMDYGLCMFNSKWWIGKGKAIPDFTTALNNPLFCAKIMTKEFKNNNEKFWVCYSGDYYKKFLNKYA